MDIALDGLVLATAWLHTVLSPYTKVEESFNLHAVHDVLMYGVGGADLHKYDHFVFPGAVPRTFIGSVLLAWASTPVLHLASHLGLLESKFDVQVVVRLTLATFNALGICLVRHAVSKRFGRKMGVYYAVLTCSQFHLPFWMGRTIPNMFALFFVNLSTYILLNRAPNSKKPSQARVSVAISVLTFACVVFRAELALYLAPLCAFALATKTISLGRLLKTGIVSGLVYASLTVAVDSYFWQQPLLFPELHSVLFNVVDGKSSEWGVSPPLTYFKSYLPKLLLSALPLSFVGMVRNGQIRTFCLPAWAFVALISVLGHKEWRFIVYVVPIFNVAAARGLYSLLSPRRKTLSSRLGVLIGLGLIFANLAFTVFSTYVSSSNYPGGEAMSQFHALYNPTTTTSPVHVHISNLAAQTGASLFTQRHANPQWQRGAEGGSQWKYDKTEGLSVDQLTKAGSPYTHLILEELPSEKVLKKRGWKFVGAVNALERVKVQAAVLKAAIRSLEKDLPLATVFEGLKDVVKIERPEKLWIVERA